MSYSIVIHIPDSRYLGKSMMYHLHNDANVKALENILEENVPGADVVIRVRPSADSRREMDVVVHGTDSEGKSYADYEYGDALKKIIQKWTGWP